MHRRRYVSVRLGSELRTLHAVCRTISHLAGVKVLDFVEDVVDVF